MAKRSRNTTTCQKVQDETDLKIKGSNSSDGVFKLEQRTELCKDVQKIIPLRPESIPVQGLVVTRSKGWSSYHSILIVSTVDRSYRPPVQECLSSKVKWVGY
jgi:hypothetical protein